MDSAKFEMPLRKYTQLNGDKAPILFYDCPVLERLLSFAIEPPQDY